MGGSEISNGVGCEPSEAEISSSFELSGASLRALSPHTPREHTLRAPPGHAQGAQAGVF